MSGNVTKASCDECMWPSLAAEPDYGQQARIAEQDRRIVELSDKAEKLELERDGLLDQIGVMTEEISELMKKQPYTFDVNDVRGAIRLVGRYIDELTDELAKRDKGIARLKRRRDELERALEIDGRIKASQDGAIEEIARQRDEALDKLGEYEGRAEAFTILSGGSLYVGSRALTEEVAKLEKERDYWKREVELCMQAAYPPSHSPSKGYAPNVMAYPDRHGCTTPSTMVSDVIDGLRDAAQDGFFKARLGDVSELERERDEWKAIAKSYEENYVGPLREVGFDVHAKAIAAAIAAMGEELERTRADREEWRAKFGKALDCADEIRRLA